ncbi:zinc ribbon domain-containing protein [Clostridiales bacterium COT073_COT-073]|nr:zinc ribbon domain-containing protein [Clostridiales bacterium COT073_COT-073]
METVRDYKCLSCGAGLYFDPALQNWKCQYCRSVFNKDQLDSYYRAKEEREKQRWAQQGRKQAASAQPVELDAYFCKNCGAEIVGDHETIATFCLYCKSPTIIKARMQGEFTPRYIIPFEIDHKRAKEIYGKWIKKHLLAPSAFKRDDEIDKIRGIYAPYWLFHADNVQVYVRGTGTIDRVWQSGKTEYTETSYFAVERGGFISYQNVPVDGSKKLDDMAMMSIEPFYYERMTNFSMDYMTGFFAERYDVDRESLQEMAKDRMSRFAISKINSTHNYSGFTEEYKNVSFHEVRADYSLFPIYILTNAYKGKNIQYIMNGQTGKIYGEVPISFKKLFSVFFISFLIVWLILGMGGVLLD